MKPEQKEKLERFFDDVLLAETVHDILFEAFLDEDIKEDVHTLAAARLSISFFQYGWSKLEKYKRKENSAQTLEKNIGL